MAEVADRVHHTTRAGTAGERGYLTVREAADRLNMHFMSVYKLVQSGRLPAAKLGHRWKIDPARLEEWIEGQQATRHTWLVVGAGPGLAERLSEAVGDAQQVRSSSFARLAEALADQPDLVLIDPAGDGHAALAALEICRSSRHRPAVLLVDDDQLGLLGQALAGGVVTAMPRRVDTATVAQLELLQQRS